MIPVVVELPREGWLAVFEDWKVSFLLAVDLVDIVENSWMASTYYYHVYHMPLAGLIVELVLPVEHCRTFVVAHDENAGSVAATAAGSTWEEEVAEEESRVAASSWSLLSIDWHSKEGC